MLALWGLYSKADKKNKKLFIYTLMLLNLMRKVEREINIINAQNVSYTKEEVEIKRLKEVDKLLNKQYTQIEKLIEDSLIDSYVSTEKILNKELHIDEQLTLEAIKNVVNSVWVGNKNFKQRLEWNLREIYKKFKELQQEEIDTLKLKELQKNYYYRLRRLLDTETHHTINSACQHAYERADIEFVEWIAHEDEKTCPVCRSYDRKIFIRQSAPFCPDHPFCRCLIIPSTEEDYKRWISLNMGYNPTK